MNKSNRIIVSIVAGVVGASLLAWIGVTSLLYGLMGPGNQLVENLCENYSHQTFAYECVTGVGSYALCGSPILGVILFVLLYFLLPRNKDE